MKSKKRTRRKDLMSPVQQRNVDSQDVLNRVSDYVEKVFQAKARHFSDHLFIGDPTSDQTSMVFLLPDARGMNIRVFVCDDGDDAAIWNRHFSGD